MNDDEINFDDLLSKNDQKAKIRLTKEEIEKKDNEREKEKKEEKSLEQVQKEGVEREYLIQCISNYATSKYAILKIQEKTGYSHDVTKLSKMSNDQFLS